MYYVYMLTNKNNKVLYTGVTNNLKRRLYEHKNKFVDGFTKKYNVDKLVYYEITNDVNSALAREKQIKGWTRAKKNALVESKNSQWCDLTESIMQI
ncbi:MAG: GIY-YIG nuclease family protein [Clostridia bacterium]|nr:GIY-YIG nuclease family protein [Clostridia bacterium]